LYTQFTKFVWDQQGQARVFRLVPETLCRQKSANYQPKLAKSGFMGTKKFPGALTLGLVKTKDWLCSGTNKIKNEQAVDKSAANKYPLAVQALKLVDCYKNSYPQRPLDKIVYN